MKRGMEPFLVLNRTISSKSLLGWWSPIPLIFQPLPIKLMTFFWHTESPALRLCLKLIQFNSEISHNVSKMDCKCSFTFSLTHYVQWRTCPVFQGENTPVKRRGWSKMFVWEEHLASGWDDYETMRYSKTKYRLYYSIPYSNIHILSFDVIYFF